MLPLPPISTLFPYTTLFRSIDYGFRLPSAADNRPLTFEEFENHIHQAIYVSATPGPYELQHTAQEDVRSEEHTSELQSRQYLVCRLLLEKKKIIKKKI